MEPLLTILVVTKAEPFAVPFLKRMSALADALRAEFVVGADGEGAAERLAIQWTKAPVIVIVKSKGYIESVLDVVLRRCTGRYVLRLDDDEQCSPAMVSWLVSEAYTTAKHWKFPRAHVWGDERTMLLHPALWPDHQTRLSLRELAGGRTVIHCGSPYGGGTDAGVVIEHHKFLVKSLEERRAIVRRYDGVAAGAGSCMAVFSTPEDVVDAGAFRTAPVGSGFAEAVRV